MPDINSVGQVVSGRGVAFLDGATLIQQVGSDAAGWQVSTRPYTGGPWTPVYDRGCTIIAAGSGRWMATLDGYGTFGQDGLIAPPGVMVAGDRQYARGSCAPDGTIGLILDFNASKGLRLIAMDGSYVDYPDATPDGASVCIVNRTQASFINWHTRRFETVGGLPVPQTLPGPVFCPTMLQANGRWWIVYNSSDSVGAVMHPADDPTRGYRFPNTPPSFYLFARATDNTHVTVAWSGTAIDSPTTVQVVDVTAPMVDLPNGGTPVPQPPTPQPPIVTIPGYKPTPQTSYGRKGYYGFFFATDLRTGNYSCPGNCEVLANGTVAGNNQQVARPYFVSLASIGNPPDQILGFFNPGPNDDSLSNVTLQAALTWMRSHGHPKALMLRYFDGTPLPEGFVETSESDAAILIQAYPRDSETTDQTMARVRGCISQVNGTRRILLDRGFNSKYGGLQPVLDLQAPLCDLERADPNIIGSLPFSWGRSDGGAYLHPELQTWAQELAHCWDQGLP